jgi:hypothetical protein
VVGQDAGNLVGDEVDVGVDIELPGWQWKLLDVLIDLVEDAWESKSSAGKARG